MKTIYFITIGILASVLFLGSAQAEDFLYTDAEADCAAQMIFMNECSGKEQNLLYWSPDEAFPSLGIGHFIWYPENASAPYLESFPAFLDFAEEIGLVLPLWIDALSGRHSPWRTREEFQRDLNSARGKELRVFLGNTKREQAQYILRRFRRVFPRILDDLDESERQPVQKKYDLLMLSNKAAFAMIDYVNFKGEGLRTDARYEGVGWGLAQVLIEMTIPDDPEKVLDEFISAAERVLERRISHSPRPEIEAKWLPGWKNRLRNYMSIKC
ncbi:MAG TPA: hypothetical protein VL404_08565 [Candidatus Eisenbacteria bacterium]|jgi:hypothetical protein|nr:hypothetical protein [Candidatus Eisenbacteria bacterium]